MLLILLFWAWILVVSLGLGLSLARGLRAAWGPLPRRLTSSPELLSLTGLAALAWLVAVLSFAWPVALPMQLGVSALAGAGLLVNRAALRQLLGNYYHSWQVAGAGAIGLVTVLGLLVLVHAAQPPTFPDATLYHAQFVQWLHRFAVVPGLGNLHGRLAFNSHTHLLTAFFSPAGALGRGPAFQQTVNSFGFLLLVLYHGRRAARHLRPGGQPELVAYYLGSLLLLLAVARPWISSPLPDTTVAVLGLLLLGLLLETPRLAPAGLVWLGLLAATAVTFKASAAALLLWPVAWALRQPARRWGRGLRRLAGGVLLVGLPWLGRNVVLSGYAAYPLAGGLGPVVAGWAVPAPRRAADLAEIRRFARRPVSDWQRAAQQPLRQWLPFWWQQQALADQFLLLLVAAGVVLVTGSLAGQPPTRWWRRADYQLYGLLLLGCGWWFVAAPALRFAYAYLLGAATLGPLLVGRAWPGRWVRVGGRLLSGLSLLYGLNGLAHELRKPATLARYAVWPADYPAGQPTLAGRLGPYPVRTVRPSGRCGNCPLPCTDTLYTGLELRGPTLQQGFRMKLPGAAGRQ